MKKVLALFLLCAGAWGQALLPHPVQDFVPYKSIRVVLHKAPYKEISFQMLTVIVAGKAGTTAPPAEYTGPGDIIISDALAYWALRAYTSAARGGVLAVVCSAGDAMCGNMSSDATTGNAVIPGFCGGGCTAQTMKDISGAMNCSGPCDVTQATEALRPTVTANCSGSLPCLTFAAGQYLVSAGMGSTGPIPLSMTFVGQRVAFASGYTNALGITSQGALGYPDMANLVFNYDGDIFSVAASDGSFHSVQGLMNATSSTLVVDGSSTGGSAGMGGYGEGQTLHLGDPTATDTQKLFEGGIWIADKTTNFAALYANQHTHWGY